MYIEDNIEKEVGYSNVFNQNQNEFLILEELKHGISTQFNFENLGYNYLKDYENPPLEIYDWLFTHFNETYFVIENLINIYEQVDRIKILSTIIYEFLFIDILQIIPKINVYNNLKNELGSVLTETLQSLLVMKSEINSSDKLNYEILKYSTIISILDTNIEDFKENYWAHILQKIIM